MNRSRLNTLFDQHNVDAIVSLAPQTRLWYSEIQTTDGIIIIEKNNAYLFVDGRYIEYCQKNAKNVNVELLTGDSIKDFFAKKAYKNVVLEKDYLLKNQYDFLLSLMGNVNVTWINGQELRILKDKKEQAIMQRSIDISLKAYEDLLKWIKPGMTEKEVAARLNYLMKLYGAEKESFDEIVAAGKNSAEPHHHPTNDVLVEGEILKCDFGALYKGYSADITRTIILGGKSKVKNPKLVEILEIVQEAAKKGRDFVKPGILASEVDKVCRQYIEEKGYGKYFVHSTGHGLGIDVHEMPSVGQKSDYVLEPGMVITVEPGIYIPGLGGARNEDDVLVTEKGHIVMSRLDENSVKY